VAVLLIARFSGDVAELTRAYDRVHEMIMATGGAVRFGELRHHCATGPDALYIVGVWQSKEHVQARWQSPEFEERLMSVGFPSPKIADITVLDLIGIEPPL
jgi:quinol monooxygenase YgiN